MKALVTGAGGFAGHALVGHLEEAGDEVVGLDRAAGPDILDAAAVRDVMARHRPDAVYHLAAVTHIGASWDAPLEVFRINAEGTFNVLSACAAAGVDRVLVVGSADEYGAVRPEDLPLSEDAPLRPLTPYGASKVAADYLALQAFLGGGLRVIRVRAFNHTGPTQSERFMVPGLARRIAAAERENRKEIPIGSLEPVRDFTNVADVVAAYRLLIERGEPGEVYNVCSGVGHSVAEVAEHLLGLARHAIELVPDPALVRPVEVPRLVGDNRRLREATGWEPTIPFEETLASILERWRAEVPDR
ncbi:MAG: GDP-4-dehydro-6-deoxy-D-mannose reductase [Actinomycetota bacterium]|jgi:GDP-4-dehydro-6-deoxy-D-mannose reductase|nr:GDP-4-dehydro-6-deoxy-D-mannose reductase [Actinomycetota bacterium]MDQ1501550.1 GDP-4-dehydro-6-deoxy-D-mannose reductase [Actinomycetota bacterium]